MAEQPEDTDNLEQPEPRRPGFKLRNLMLIIGPVMMVVYLIMVMGSGGDLNGDGVVAPSEAELRWTRGLPLLVVGALITLLAGMRIAAARKEQDEADGQ